MIIICQRTALKRRNRTYVSHVLLLVSVALCAARGEARQQVQDTHAVFLPGIVKSRLAPSATTSYYITKFTTERAAQLLGCSAAVEMQQNTIPKGYVALFFGDPAYEQGTPHTSGRYGVDPVGNLKFMDIDTVKTFIKVWIKGFAEGFHYPDSSYDCGIQNNVYPYRPYVTLGIGINNKDLSFPAPENSTDRLLSDIIGVSMEGHGIAWADLVNDIHQYVLLNNWSEYISASTSYDAEVLYNSIDDTKDWLKGYTTTTSNRYYYLGACEGCPFPQPWTTQDMWDITAGSNATLIPQIYTTNGQTARQWGLLAAILRQTPDPNSDVPGTTLTPLVFNGVLTQHGACDDRGYDSTPRMSGSEYCDNGETYNTPEQGWNQTNEAFIAYGVLPNLFWLTDVRYNQDFTRFQK